MPAKKTSQTNRLASSEIAATPKPPKAILAPAPNARKAKPAKVLVPTLWWSASQLAAAGLKGGFSASTYSRLINSCSTPNATRKRDASGGGNEIFAYSLPAAVLAQLQKKQLIPDVGVSTATGQIEPKLPTIDVPLHEYFSKRRSQISGLKIGTHEQNGWKKFQFRLLFAEIIVRFAEYKRCDIRTSYQFWVGVVIDSMEECDFAFIYDRWDARETANREAFIKTSDLKAIISGGTWRKESGVLWRYNENIKALVKSFIKELDVPDLASSLNSFCNSYLKNIPISRGVLITLSRHEYIIGIPYSYYSMRYFSKSWRRVYTVRVSVRVGQTLLQQNAPELDGEYIKLKIRINRL